MKKFIPTVICAALLCLLIYPLADDDTIDAANQVEYTEFYDAAVSPMETEIAVDNSVQELEAEVDVDTTSDETSETETEELPATQPPLNSTPVEVEAPAVESESETVATPAEEADTTETEAAAVETETETTTEDVPVEETETTSEVETIPEVSATETTEPETTPVVETVPEETPVVEAKKPHNSAYYEVGTPSGSPADHNIVCDSEDLSHLDHIEAYAELLPDEVWTLFLNHGWKVVATDDVAAATGYDHRILGLCSFKTSQITIENSVNGESGIVHEIGHFVDEFHAGYHYGQKASSSEEFAAIWAVEGETMGQLILTGSANYATPLEFFAECVRCYFLYNDELKASCPQAYTYVEQVIDEFVANVHAEIEAAEAAEATEAAMSDTETAETETTTTVPEVEWPELTDPDFED